MTERRMTRAEAEARAAEVAVLVERHRLEMIAALRAEIAAATPRGCVCPPTSEQTCQAALCPRRGAPGLSPFTVRRETI